MKKVKLFVIFLSFCFSLPATAVDISSQQQVLDDFQLNLKECVGSYNFAKEMFNLSLKKDLMQRLLEKTQRGDQSYLGEVDKLEAREKASKETSVETTKYQTCVTNAKEKVSKVNIKLLLQKFTKNQQSSMKALIAQWLTALDSIGKDNQDQETSNFDLSVNKMKVDLLSS